MNDEVFAKWDVLQELKRSPVTGEFCECGSEKNKYGCIAQQIHSCAIYGSAMPEALMAAWEEANAELFAVWNGDKK